MSSSRGRSSDGVRAVLIGVVIAIAMVAGACSGGSSSSSNAKFVEQGNEICRRLIAAIDEVPASKLDGYRYTTSEWAAEDRAIATIRRQYADEFAALKAPAGAKADLDALVARQRRIADELDTATTTLEKKFTKVIHKDEVWKSYDQIDVNLGAPLTDRSIEERLGFTDCIRPTEAVEPGGSLPTSAKDLRGELLAIAEAVDSTTAADWGTVDAWKKNYPNLVVVGPSTVPSTGQVSLSAPGTLPDAEALKGFVFAVKDSSGSCQGGTVYKRKSSAIFVAWLDPAAAAINVPCTAEGMRAFITRQMLP